MHLTAFNLFPRTRRRYWRAGLRTHCVSCRKRRAVTVAPGINENASTAISFAELLRQVIRVAFDQNTAHLMCKTRDRAEVRLAIERHGDVKTFRSTRFDPRSEERRVGKECRYRGSQYR